MSRARFLVGDVRERLTEIDDNSVDLVMTSPPFLALRSYLRADHPDKGKEIGSEPDPGVFIDVMCSLVDDLSRVLAPHGSMVFEFGDTYAGSGGAGGDYTDEGWRDGQETFRQSRNGGWPRAKSLALVPELFRITLAYGTNPLTGRVWWEGDDRWMVRNVVRWVRPNPPVGALGDKFRPATSDLCVFTRDPKRWFDLDAVRTEHKYGDYAPKMGEKRSTFTPLSSGDNGKVGKEMHPNPAGAPPLDWWNGLSQRIDAAVQRAASGGYEQADLFGDDDPKRKEARETVGRKIIREAARAGEVDLGDVFNVTTAGYPGSHYAVYPPELCVIPIKSMCPERVCRECGEPSRRITNNTRLARDGSIIDFDFMNGRDAGLHSVNLKEEAKRYTHTERITEGWTDCGHDQWRTGTVLDPFAGSGTTLAVATGHGRDAVGIDLDERNADLALDRVGPMFLEVVL